MNKLPEPVAFRAQIDNVWFTTSNKQKLENELRWAQIDTARIKPLYDQDSVMAVLEQAAQICEHAKTLYAGSMIYADVPGILQIRADEIRQMLTDEALKKPGQNA